MSSAKWINAIYDGCVNNGHTVISFIFTFKLLVNLLDSHFLICIRYDDSVSKGHTPLAFIQTCTFLLVTLIHLSKQGFVNSLTILFLYFYVHNLHWTNISFIFTFKLLVNLLDSHFLICIRYDDSVSKGHTPLAFIQTCTFLLVTLIHLSKQGFVNSLTILFLYFYVHNLYWTKLVELSHTWQWQTMSSISYCYERTWAVMALVDSIVVYGWMIIIHVYSSQLLHVDLFYF